MDGGSAGRAILPQRKTGHNWPHFRVETDQATRWLAFAPAEVSGHKDLPHLVAALERPKKKQPEAGQ